MSQDPFVFVKSLEDRLKEYNNILTSNLKATEIKDDWSNYAELSIEPVGWRAIWKISRDMCIELKTTFPCTVVVMVQHVNFKDLSCLASIIEVEDEDVSLPQQVNDIPLIELYPTIDQDNSCALSTLFETAKLIDSLRFFYNNLWMPWDLDYDEGSSWAVSHLEGRLKLHFALVERKVPHEVAYTVRKLVTEGRKVQKEIEDIQDQLADEMEVDGYPNKLLELTELHNRMSSLRNEYSIYEKPDLLEALIQRIRSIEKSQQEIENCESIVVLVLSTSTPEQLLRLAKMMSEVKLIRYFQTLQEALVKSPSHSSIRVVLGKHSIHDLGNLEAGGTIKGMEPGVVLTEEMEGSSGWSLLQGSLTFDSLTIQMSSVWNIIKVRPGAECVLREVTLEGASLTDGVDVFPGAKLVANNCHFANCRTAIACDTNCSVKLSNCSFTNNKVAIELKEGCNFLMENCSISESKLYGVNILINCSSQVKNDAIECLNSISGIRESGTTYKNNAMNLHFMSTTLKRVTSDQSADSDLLSASR